MLRRRLRLGRCVTAAPAEQVEHGQRVDAEDPARHECDGHAAQADTSPAEPAAPAAAATPVFDVLALFLAFPLHDALR